MRRRGYAGDKEKSHVPTGAHTASGAADAKGVSVSIHSSNTIHLRKMTRGAQLRKKHLRTKMKQG